MMRKFLLAALLIPGTNSFAQDSLQTATPAKPFTFNGYVEVYYSYDFNNPPDNNKPGFLYSHNRHNEFNLNIGFLKGSYQGERIRANLAIAAGTYMNANYAAEPGTLKNIYEANAGIKISKKKNLWIDAGIFSSHLGFESAVSKDCWTLTRSIVAENIPYFETGVKLTYTSDNNKWLLSGFVLNGWQRIKRVEGNSLMSYGTQVQYKPNETTTLNYSTFIGTDKPDSLRKMRYYNNLYTIFNVTKKLGIIVGLDIGMEQKATGSSDLYTFYSPGVNLKYSFNSKWSVTGRGEYYYDKHGVIISTGTSNGFQTMGLSFNIDYAPVKNAVARIEIRGFNSKDDVFTKNNTATDNNAFITSSIAVSF